MDELFFWNNWKKPDKYIYWSILCVFLAAFCWLIYTFSSGEKNLINWEVVEEPYNLTVEADNFSYNLFDYTLNLENYLVVQHFVPSAYAVDFTAAHIYFGFIIIALIVFVTALTYAKKIIYYSILMTFLIAWIVLMKLDVHAIFGVGNQYFTFFVIILYLAASYFCYITPKISLVLRLGLVSLVTAIWTTLVVLFSAVDSPILHLTNFGVIFPAIITLLFFLLVGYEIIRLFLFMISYSKSSNPKSNIYNLLIISVLYLGNLLLMYLNDQGLVNWDLVYLNPFVLLFISTLVGFWGNKVRSSFTSKFISFAPGASLLYLAWAIVAISTLGYSFAGYNSSFIRVFEEGIIYSHLAMGASFLIYILSNFLHLFQQNKPVYKRMYDSINLPYYTVWVSALMFSYILISKVYYLPYYRFISGYENNLGDVYMAEDNPLLTKKYFEKSVGNYPGNRKGGYALASIYLQEGNYDKAINELKTINNIEPSEFTYGLLAESYKKKGEVFQDAWALEDGLELFPDVPELLNNYAYSYYEMPKLDSASKYFKKALEYGNSKKVAESNLLAYNAMYYPGRISIEKVASKKSGENLVYDANKLAFFNLNKIPEPVSKPELPEQNSLSKSVLINNYIVYEAKKDHNNAYTYIKDIQEKEDVYFSNLDLMYAWLASKNGDVGIAKNILDSLKETIPMTLEPYYANASALILLQGDQLADADNYFETSSLGQRFVVLNKAPLYWAETAIATGDTAIYKRLNRARISWPIDSLLIDEMAKSLTYSDKLTDKQKYWNILFYRWYRGNSYLMPAISAINSKDIKAKAIGAATEVSLAIGDLAGAQQLWALMPTGDIQQNTIEDLNFIYFDLAVQEGNKEDLKEVIDHLPLPEIKEKYRGLYRAILLQEEEPEQAEELFQWSAVNIPIDPKVPFYYAKFLYSNKKLQETYTVLVDAVQQYPENITLLQFYSFISLEMGYESYADYALEELEYIMPPDAFAAFNAEYQTRKDTLLQTDTW